jgi:hypothetical protein
MTPMGKAKGNHTPEQPPLDDDVHWMPLDEAVELRQRRTRHLALAVLDLRQDVASGRVHCMRRNLTSGEREPVPRSFWQTHFFETFSHQVIIYRRTDIESTPLYRLDDYGNIAADRLDGWMFYVWRPDFDRLYSVGSAQAENDEEPILPVDRATAALRALYRTKAEVPRSLKALTTAVDGYCKKKGWKLVSSTDTVHRAAEQLGYRAPRKPRPPRKRK